MEMKGTEEPCPKKDDMEGKTENTACPKNKDTEKTDNKWSNVHLLLI